VTQIVHTSIIVFGCVVGLLALLLAIPGCRLRAVIYRFAGRINQHRKQLP
jgi:hypothetical protein